MKNRNFVIGIIVALATILSALSSEFIPLQAGLYAQIPRTLSYQGVLTDSLGNPKPDNTYSITFRLYDVAVGGNVLWTEVKSLQVKRGLFTTILGDLTPLPDSLQSDRPYWLSLQVASEPELAPRLPLTAVGYSLYSLKADTARYALGAPVQLVVDSARIASSVPDNSITGGKISNDQVVRSINNKKDNITIAGQGGATVTSGGDTIYINAGSGGDSTGIFGIQNTNNTLDITNPNGPTVTVNVKSGVFLPLDGGIMTGAITNTGNPSITMGKGNFGTGNTNNGVDAFVAGSNNKARGSYSVVSGGGGANLADSNAALGDYSTIGGGRGNRTHGESSTVSGGMFNNSSEQYAMVGGGRNNIASGYSSSIGGGTGNSAGNDEATVGGGLVNNAGGVHSVVGGGRQNKANGSQSVVSGGWYNIADGDYSSVGGGIHNNARGIYSVVSGGGGFGVDSNSAIGDYSTIPGGVANLTQGSYSFAAGRRAKALYNGSFVWGDAANSDVESDTTNQFKIRATNGMNLSVAAGQSKIIRKGDYYADNSIVAWGNINGDGSVGSTFGVNSVTRNSAGNYTITLHVTTGNANTLVPYASAEVDALPGSAATARLIYIDQINTTSFNVYITNGSYTATDNEFTFVVTGR